MLEREVGDQGVARGKVPRAAGRPADGRGDARSAHGERQPEIPQQRPCRAP